MLNYLETIQSEYATSPTLVQLITNWNTYLDPTASIDSFFSMIFDLKTAQGAGLDIWGRRLGVTRVITLPAAKYFGFSGQSSAVAIGFGQGPFYTGAGVTTNYPLSDTAFRTLLYAKALANICNGSIPALNQILLTLFPGRGDCWVTDGQNMSMTYHFTFDLAPFEYAIVSTSGVMPKPAGIVATIVEP